MRDFCLFFRKMPSSAQLYALAICAHLPLRGSGLQVRRFASEAELTWALTQTGVLPGERVRIAKVLTETGRALTYFTQAQAEKLCTVPLLQWSEQRTAPVARPAEFQILRITARGVPYQVLGPYQELTSIGGALPAGQEVWLKQMHDGENLVPTTHAFVEEIGLVALDTRWLQEIHPASFEETQPRPSSRSRVTPTSEEHL